MIDRDATLVIDSFTLCGWLSQWFTARFPGQIVDAGPLAPVGHGIGMAIGAQLARPGKQVVVVIGDGGLGIGGLDIETALALRPADRHGALEQQLLGAELRGDAAAQGRTDPFDMLPDHRYDRMFEAMGCHGEHVERPEAVPAGARARLESGKASLINVIGDRRSAIRGWAATCSARPAYSSWSRSRSIAARISE